MAYWKTTQSLLHEVCCVAHPSPISPTGTPNAHPAARAQHDGVQGNTRDALVWKKEALLHLLDKLEERYRRYRDSLNKCNAQAGLIFGTTYTITCHKYTSSSFRRVKDAMKRQLRVVARALARIDASTSRQHHPSNMAPQYAYWRPYRLPVYAKSILRAYFFQNFLHPYPSYGAKTFLAQQTGLQWKQVSNWFRNTRVLMWKPMIEQLYMEAKKEEEAQAQETAARAAQENAKAKGIWTPKIEQMWQPMVEDLYLYIEAREAAARAQPAAAEAAAQAAAQAAQANAKAKGILIPKTERMW